MLAFVLGDATTSESTRNGTHRVSATQQYSRSKSVGCSIENGMLGSVRILLLGSYIVDQEFEFGTHNSTNHCSTQLLILPGATTSGPITPDLLVSHRLGHVRVVHDYSCGKHLTRLGRLTSSTKHATRLASVNLPNVCNRIMIV